MGLAKDKLMEYEARHFNDVSDIFVCTKHYTDTNLHSKAKDHEQCFVCGEFCKCIPLEIILYDIIYSILKNYDDANEIGSIDDETGKYPFSTVNLIDLVMDRLSEYTDSDKLVKVATGAIHDMVLVRKDEFD